MVLFPMPLKTKRYPDSDLSNAIPFLIRYLVVLPSFRCGLHRNIVDDFWFAIESWRGERGAIILIGPIPIVLGSGPYSVGLVAIASVLTVVAIIFFLIMRRRV